eukprot:10192736-Karenia_brevis.AAC.1
MIAVLQIRPARATVLKDILCAPKPTASEMLSTLEHIVEAHQGKLICHMRGQVWLNPRKDLGYKKCPGPAIWGTPQLNRP